MAGGIQVKPMTIDSVRGFIGRMFSDSLSAGGYSPDALPDDLDLIATGIIDSLGLMELIAGLETELDAELDFDDLAPEDLTIVGPFCRFVAAFGQDDQSRTE
jgi:acyl carrier protein